MVRLTLLKVFLFVLVVSASCPITSGAESMSVHIRKNVAHRGSSATAPENTLSAYRLAISDGADGAECDVYASSDGIVFLSHDKTPKRTMGGEDTPLTAMTFEEIRKRDAGSWKGMEYKGEKVPTLDEYLKILKGTTCHPVIEIKMEGIEAKVLDAVRKYDMVDNSSIIAFSDKVVKEIRRLEPKICVAWLYSENLKDKGTPEENADRLANFLIKRAKELDTTELDLDYRILSKKLVKALTDAGIHVWCWTIDDENKMKQMLDWGVVSITTNKPALLKKVLDERTEQGFRSLSVPRPNP